MKIPKKINVRKMLISHPNSLVLYFYNFSAFTALYDLFIKCFMLF